MSRIRHINIVILISAAFIFRLLFITISIYSPENSEHFKSANQAGKCEYSLATICEENFDDDDKFKSGNLPSPILYLLVANEISNNSSKTSTLCTSLSYNTPQLYLLFGVFRI